MHRGVIGLTGRVSQTREPTNPEHELAVAVRQGLVLRLWPLGLWPDPGDLARYATEQHAIGLAGTLRVLTRVLGGSDIGHLLRRGAWDGRVSLNPDWPSMFAFGVSFARAIQEIAGSGHKDKTARADACGLFNVGITLVDRLIDEDRANTNRLLELLDRGRLVALLEDPRALTDFEAVAQAEPATQLRLLCKVALGYFSALQALRVGGPDSHAAFARLSAVLLDAFDAELASGPGWLGDEREIARRKSCLPLLAMSIVATLSWSVEPERAALVRAAAEDVAEAIWLIDDLADLIPDAQSGAPNGILGRVRSSNGTEKGLNVLQALSEGGHVEAAIDRLVERMSTLKSRLLTSDVPGPKRRPMLDFLTMYVAGWIPD